MSLVLTGVIFRDSYPVTIESRQYSSHTCIQYVVDSCGPSCFKKEGAFLGLPDPKVIDEKHLSKALTIIQKGDVSAPNVPPLDPPMYIQSCLHLLKTQAGNISELLLREGFARCVDWSMAVLTKGHEKLRAAEKYVLVLRHIVYKLY